MKTERAPTPNPTDVDGHAEPSPLAVIRELEDRMAARIDAARAAASERVAAARSEADQITASERADAEDRAEAAYRAALAGVRAEAERIRSAAAERAATLQERGERRLDDASAAVLAFVLPESLDACGLTEPPEANVGGDPGG